MGAGMCWSAGDIVHEYPNHQCPPGYTKLAGDLFSGNCYWNGYQTFAGQSGFYFGGQIGERRTTTNWTAISQVTLNIPDLLASPATSLDTSQVRGKFSTGYDWTFSRNWVVGAVTDVGFGNSLAMQPRIPGTFGAGGLIGPANANAAFNDSISVNQTWDVSLRGRLGVNVLPNILFYGTAGVDFLHTNASLTCTLPGACGAVGVPVVASGSTTETGWVAGGGVEFGLGGLGLGPNWRGQVEYLHADFGTYNVTLGSPATLATTVNLKETTDTLMFGFRYLILSEPLRR
jgi:opacity protein-like surface antigen